MSHRVRPEDMAASRVRRPHEPGAAGLAAPPDVPADAGQHRRSRRDRHPALDGLRGVAALVVVVFHVLSVSPRFDAPSTSAGPDDASWWLTHTPLGLVWAGPQAVFVFFVLSGFVLALPAGRIRWRAYYPQRLLRLYLPVWASVVLAVALVSVFPRRQHDWLSDWWDVRQPDGGLVSAIRDGLLLPSAGDWNSPLWSLHYELVFSLLLPLYLLAAKVLPRLGLLRIGVLMVVLAAAEALDIETLVYLSMFAFGVILAAERERLAAIAARVHQRGPWAWPALGLACAVLLNGELLLVLSDTQAVRGVVVALQLAGATLLIVLALHWSFLVHALSVPWVQWVGLRSFALYLVHEPIVLSLVSIAPRVHVVGYLILGLPLSLLVAHVFYRLVEAPSHRISRAAGRRAARADPSTASRPVTVA